MSKAPGFRERLARRRRPVTYSDLTHGSPWWIVRFAHTKRYQVALDMLLTDRPEVVIDWGAGDGVHVQAILEAVGPRPRLVIAYDPAPEMLDGLHTRFADHPERHRLATCATLDEVVAALDGAKVGAISVLEVLEHLPLRARRSLYDFAREHLAEDGSLVIGLPVEIGPAVLVKEVGRVVLKGRELAYGIPALLRRSIGRTSPDPDRFDLTVPEEFVFSSHTGFDHRLVLAEVARDHRITERRRTPLRWAPAWLFNQELTVRAIPRRAGG